VLKLILVLIRLIQNLLRGTVTQTLPVLVVLSGCMLLCVVHVTQSISTMRSEATWVLHRLQLRVAAALSHK